VCTVAGLLAQHVHLQGQALRLQVCMQPRHVKLCTTCILPVSAICTARWRVRGVCALHVQACWPRFVTSAYRMASCRLTPLH
jgi:hypothetical protein